MCSSQSDDDWAVFLYHKTELLKWPLLKSRPLPQNVQEFSKYSLNTKAEISFSFGHKISKLQ